MQEVNPNDTPRGRQFEIWKNAPNPMLVFVKKDGCHSPCQDKQEEAPEVQYAFGLLHWQSSSQSKRVLSIASR